MCGPFSCKEEAKLLKKFTIAFTALFGLLSIVFLATGGVYIKSDISAPIGDMTILGNNTYTIVISSSASVVDEKRRVAGACDIDMSLNNITDNHEFTFKCLNYEFINSIFHEIKENIQLQCGARETGIILVTLGSTIGIKVLLIALPITIFIIVAK